MPTLEPRAVHCPDCGAAPGRPCKSPSGKGRTAEHSERMKLVYGLAHPEANVYRAEAERYRMKHPGVVVTRVVCAPSRAQALWYGLPYNQKAYEGEHGPDTSAEGSDENECSHPLCRTATTPVATCGCACGGANHGRDGGGVEEEEEEYVGVSASDLLAQFDKLPKEPVDTVSKMTRDFVKRNQKKE